MQPLILVLSFTGGSFSLSHVTQSVDACNAHIDDENKENFLFFTLTTQSVCQTDLRGMQGCKQSPEQSWSYLVQCVCAIRQRTASNVPSMMGRTGFELVNGFTPDVLLCALHEWCDFVWWLDMHDKQEKLGRWLGPVGAQFG